MRPLAAGAAACLLALGAASARAQPGSVQISTANQVLTGDSFRLGGQPRLEPDLGLGWVQPGLRVGTLELNVHVVQRRHRPWLGLAFGALRDVKLGGLTWMVQGGDGTVTPSISDLGFTNLFAPRLNLEGLVIQGTNRTTTVTAAAGRVAALRNIFGTDTDPLDQRVGFAKMRRRTSATVEWSARISAVRTRALGEFPHFIDDSRQAGGGIRYRPLGLVEVVADGALTSFRRRGAAAFERDFSGLVGTLWALPRGWIQINAQRLSAGEFPVLHNTFTDRQGLFAAGEYDVTGRVRLFSGVEGVGTSLDLDAWPDPRQAPPHTTLRRGFGGIRTRLTSRSFVTLRAEDGVRRAEAGATTGRTSEADSRLFGAEWQASLGRWTTSGRYHRRENVDRRSASGTFLQHEAFAQVYARLGLGSELFGSAQYTRREADTGGQNFWQASAGVQLQMPERQLWLRAEGFLTEMLDTDTGFSTGRQALTVGLFGQVSRRTTIAFDLYVDRTPSTVMSGSPWTTRSTLRLVHTIPTGSARAGTGESRLAIGRTPARGTGTIAGEVFADWNANGTRDPGEEPLAHITLLVGAADRVVSGSDGEFRFTQVPAGPARVGLDATALPVDYDLPQPAHVDVEVVRDRVSRVAFGLVPLGSVRGTVVRDANGNGRMDDADESIDGAVVVLDGGARSELVRSGGFRFDAVRSGSHRVQLLADSLPTGAEIHGEPEVTVTVSRDRLDPEVGFLVRLQPRPEVRRVFPPATAPAPATAPPATPAAPAPAIATPAPRPAPPRPTPGPAAPPTPPIVPGPPPAPVPGPSASAATIESTTLQVAAVGRLDRARQLVDELRALGFDPYIVPPAAGGRDAFYRVRVGTFRDRRSAESARTALRQAARVTAAVVPGDTSRPGPFRVQVAAVGAADRATALRDRLAALGYPAYLVAPGAASADALIRVRVGPYATREEADHAAQAIRQAIGTDVWVTEEHPAVRSEGARRAPRSPSEAVSPRPRAGSGPVVIQVAALAERARAEALVERLGRLGYRASLAEPAPGGPDRLVRVLVGPFTRIDEARSVARAIEAALGITVWIRPAPSP